MLPWICGCRLPSEVSGRETRGTRVPGQFDRPLQTGSRTEPQPALSPGVLFLILQDHRISGLFDLIIMRFDDHDDDRGDNHPAGRPIGRQG